MKLRKKLPIFDIFLKNNGNLVRLLFLMAGVFALMSILRPHLFPTWNNISSMSVQFPEFGLLCIAMALTMITGGNDLAIVAEANLSSIIAAKIMISCIKPGISGTETTAIIIMVVVLALCTGIVCGFINGLLISKIGISPILTTLGTMQAYTGISVILTRGTAVVKFPEVFLRLGNGKIAGIPVPLLIFAATSVLIAFIMGSTRFGLRVFMFGANPAAAKFSGIKNSRVQTSVYMISGMIAAVAGLIIMSRTNSAKADYGQSYILQTILVSVMGGVSPSGGRGKILTVTIAVITLQFISSGFNMLRLSSYLKNLVWGLLLLAIIISNYYVEKHNNKIS
jgi:simple sugar transport system permease protein